MEENRLRETERLERDVLRIFDFTLIVKMLNGGLEMLTAVLVLTVPPQLVVRTVEFLTGGEIAPDPDDLVGSLIRSAAHSFAVHSHYFLASYLAVHGAVKVALVAGIFSGKKVAYPLFMFALACFGSYELYRGTARHETLLLALAAFDFLVLFLTAYEYRRRYPTRASFPGTRADSGGQ